MLKLSLRCSWPASCSRQTIFSPSRWSPGHSEIPCSPRVICPRRASPLRNSSAWAVPWATPGRWWPGTTYMAQVLQAQGQLHQARALLDETLAEASQQGVRSRGYIARVENGLASVLYEQNELEAANHLLAEAILLIRHWPNPNHLIYTYVLQTRVLLAQGDHQGARIAIGKADQIIRNSSPHAPAPAHCRSGAGPGMAHPPGGWRQPRSWRFAGRAVQCPRSRLAQRAGELNGERAIQLWMNVLRPRLLSWHAYHSLPGGPRRLFTLLEHLTRKRKNCRPYGRCDLLPGAHRRCQAGRLPQTRG